MNKITRRNLIRTGVAATVGVVGLGAADRIARRYGLIPPDGGTLYGPGETLTYAAQRLLTRHSLAREFPRSMISAKPFGNAIAPPSDAFKRHQAAGFADWRLTVDGMVAHPTTFSLADLKSLPTHNQITEVVCEEGWSYIAEWIGTPLVNVLDHVGVLPQARYVAYFSIEPDWWESVDMADALAPADLPHHGHERRRSARWLRRPAAPARPPPTRLQEREVHPAHHGDRLHEALRQRPGLGVSRRRLRLVRGDLEEAAAPHCAGCR